MTELITPRSLSEIGTLVSIVGLPLLLLSVVIAANQLRSQAASSARQASLHAFLTFSERYMETSALRRQIESRAISKDVTLNHADVMVYYNRYWALRQVEWEYFLMGLLPTDIYTAWAENACRQMMGEKSLLYFDGNDWKSVRSDNVFDNYVAKGIYRRHPACLEFFSGLRAITEQLNEKAVPLESEQAFDLIRKYVESVARKRRVEKAWRLDTRRFGR